MTDFHKLIPALLALLLCGKIFGQELDGKLFILNEGSFASKGTIGYISYPDGIYTHIDSIAAYGNQVVYDGNLLAAVDGAGDLHVYDAATYTHQISLPLDARQVARYTASQVLVASNKKPYFRVFDSNTGSIVYTLDSTVIPTAREGMVVQGNYAYVYGFNNDTVVYVVDLAAQQLDTTIITALNNNWGTSINGLVMIGCPDYTAGKTILHTISGSSIIATDTLEEYLSLCGSSDTAIYLKAFGMGVVAFNPFTLTGDTLDNTAAAYAFQYHAATGVGFYSLTDFSTTGSVGYWIEDLAYPPVNTHISPRSFAFTGTLTTSVDAPDPANATVYPNPARDRMYIRTTATAAVRQWHLTDLTGKTVGQGTGTTVDCSNLHAGWYFLHVDTGQSSLLIKPVRIIE